MASTAAAAPSANDGPSAPLRRCIVTRTSRRQHELLRFVVGPDGTVVFDAAGKLPGRGLWLTCRRAILARAIRRGVFGKALRRRVTVPDDLDSRVEAALVARCQDRLALARRGRAVVSGFGQVHGAVKAARLAALVVATDAGTDGPDRLARTAAGAAPGLAAVQVLTAGELGGPFGRAAVSYAALHPGGTATAFWGAAERLAWFRECESTALVAAPALTRRRSGAQTIAGSHDGAESDS